MNVRVWMCAWISPKGFRQTLPTLLFFHTKEGNSGISETAACLFSKLAICVFMTLLFLIKLFIYLFTLKLEMSGREANGWMNEFEAEIAYCTSVNMWTVSTKISWALVLCALILRILHILNTYSLKIWHINI